MVEREPGQIIQREPRRAPRIGGGLEVLREQVDQRVIGHGHDASARITPRGAERVELLEKNAVQPGFLFQLAERRGVKRLSFPHKTAGKRPFSLEGRQVALNKKDL